MPFKPTELKSGLLISLCTGKTWYVQVKTSAFGLLKILEDHFTEWGRVSFQYLWDRDCILPGVTQHLPEWNCECAGTANYLPVN